MKQYVAAISIVSIACMFAGLIAASENTPNGTSRKPCLVIAGADSQVKEPRYQRITATDEWMKVWQEHKGRKSTDQYDLFHDPLALPLIDFDHYMVIAIFQGNGSNNAGLTVVEIVEENNNVILRFANKYYQTGGTDGGGHRTTAYGYFVLPRFEKPIILEENVQHYKGKPPIWKERIKFSEI